MKIDLGSFAFGSSVISGGNTPSWGSSFGQQRPGLKFTAPGFDNIIIGMMYKSIPVDKVYIRLGRGSHISNSLEDNGIQLAALFDKVYINDIKVNAPFIMVIYKENSESWAGRRTLKYNIKMEYHESEDNIISNTDFVSAAREALQIKENACWLISDIYVLNQDELHLIAGIVNPNESETYATSELRKAAYINAINTTFENNPHLIQKFSDDNLNRIQRTEFSFDLLHQQIYYGAPGTGKSHIINEITKGESVVRTTFHPDSDYSTFVGSYKPTMKSVVKDAAVISITELKKKLFDIKLSNESYPCQKFGAIYWNSLQMLSTQEIKDIVLSCSFTESMATEVAKGIAVGQNISLNSEEKITYEYVPQAFLQAYVEAWKFYAKAAEGETAKKQFLIIEEINRGNCAQIFGDLFQLLDRGDNSFSDYPIHADKDLQKYLSKAFDDLPYLKIPSIAGMSSEEIATKVRNGEILLLPNNLYIWATMNTSDQSLFPIDSAFKRRWDWQYMPISKGRDAEGNELDWRICVGEKEYDWWEFIGKINEQIESTTHSEDKKLGFFFCKAKQGIISAETFVGKVIFYLWNDVFKDFAFDSGIFKDDDGETLSFNKFYTTNVEGKVVVVNEKVQRFIENVGLNDLNAIVEQENEAE